MTRYQALSLTIGILICPALFAQPTEPAESIVLTFAGDIMQHDHNARMDDYDRIYDAVRANLLADDLSFANIEFPVDPDRAQSGYPLFNGSPEYVQAAIRGGFDVFALANNHSFDFGAESSVATRREFRTLAEETGIHHNGLRDTPQTPIVPSAITHRGWSIGFVSVTAFSNNPGSSPYVHLVDYNNPVAARAFLEQITQWDSEFDLLIIGVHGGNEYVTHPSPAKAEFFRALVAHGADIVWGHHPHVLQPWETVHDGPFNKIIMHSTGNFISAQRRLQQPLLPFGRWAPTGDTALYRLTVARGVTNDASPAQPTVVEVDTPMYTVHADPVHGLVPRTFGSVLMEPLPLVWRAFYAARYSATRGMLDSPLQSIAVRPVSR